jgi:hypothetical protein
MSRTSERRGGCAVAVLDTLPDAERVVVMALRHWADGSEGGAQLAELLQARMAPRSAAECRRALGELFGIVARHGRRRLVRHATGCPCVGADEAVLAQVVILAATGDREDAMLVGSLIVEGPLLLSFAEVARRAGLLLHRAELAVPSPAAGLAGATVH